MGSISYGSTRVVHGNGVMWFASDKLECLPWSFQPWDCAPCKTSCDEWVRRTCPPPALLRHPGIHVHVASFPVTDFNRETGCVMAHLQKWGLSRWRCCLPIWLLKNLSTSTIRCYKCEVCTWVSSESPIWYFVGFYKAGHKRKINTSCCWIINEKSIYK